MTSTLLQARLLTAATLFLLLAGGILTWRSVTHHRDVFDQVQTRLSERTRERDRLQQELAVERQRLRALEQLWSTKLETAQSEKTAAEQRLRKCKRAG